MAAAGSESFIDKRIATFQEAFHVSLLDFPHGRLLYVRWVLNRGLPELEFLQGLQNNGFQLEES